MTTDHQFGFKPGHGTDMSIFVLKEILNYYKRSNTPVFITFMDASKAFDYVRHDILFAKLLARGVKPYLIKILSYMYRFQDFVVRWNGLSLFIQRTGLNRVELRRLFFSPFIWMISVRTSPLSRMVALLVTIR